MLLGSRSVRPMRLHSLDADGKALSLGWPLTDQVGAADVGLQQVVRLLPLHVPCKPEPQRLSIPGPAASPGHL